MEKSKRNVESKAQAKVSESSESTTGAIGVISTGFHGNELMYNPYTISVLKGILSTAYPRQHNVTLFMLPWIDGDLMARRFYQTPIDGLIVLAPNIHTDLIATFQDLGIPMVATSADAFDAGIPAVDTDDARGAALATNHLIELGHKRIAHLAGTMSQGDAVTRRDTFFKVMAENGLDVPGDFMPETGFDAANAYSDATRLLSMPERPTAIFAATDYIAYWTIHAARDLGIAVPGQLSVVGYDDAPISSESSPAITTVRQPLEEMGSRAANLLFQLMSGMPVDVATELMPAELIVRASTGPAPVE